MDIQMTIKDDKGLTELAKPNQELTQEEKKQIQLAEKILQMVFANVRKKMPAMNLFLQLFELTAVAEDIVLESDGKHLFYQPERVRAMYDNRLLKKLEEALFHVLFHGILGHYSLRSRVRDTELIDKCMDYEVWQFMKDFELMKRCPENPYDMFKQQVQETLQSAGAKKLYYMVRKEKGNMDCLNQTFLVQDHHDIWYRDNLIQLEFQMKESEEGASSEGEEAGKTIAGSWEELGKLVFGEGFGKAEITRSLKGKIKDSFGNGGGAGAQKYTPLKESHRSYRDVLEEFFHCRERFQEREDTIDRQMYAYGFEMYGDVALVEPEELNELPELSTVAIAIDTSGSCTGSIMSRFLGELKNILRDASAGDSFEGIYLFQCDAKLQEETCFKEPQDLPDMAEYLVKGFGGTDFRPVFERLEELQKKDDITPSCLIYLSDGMGEYPTKDPGYPVYFVLPKDTCYALIPKWVKKLYM